MERFEETIRKAGEIKRRNIPFFLNVDEFYGLVNRIAGEKFVRHISVIQIPSETGMDEYRIYDIESGIQIEATSGVAAASAFNRYLKECCGYSVGPLFRTGILPEEPPVIGKIISAKSRFHYRYLFNYCTFGYSYAFYDWKSWEKVLDWALLSGYNLLLNSIAQETVWYNVLQRVGYSKEEAKKFLAGPAFMPWLLMMNLSDYDGSYPEWWFTERSKLAVKFTERLQAFGVGVLLPGYCGMVPDNFGKRFKNSKIVLQGDWWKYTRPALLMPGDKMFPFMAELFYSEQAKIHGSSKTHYYSVDPFHEGGIAEGINLSEFARGIYRNMTEFDGDAVWCFQGWGQNPKREILKALDNSRVLVMNMRAESNLNCGDDFLGSPWIYCTVNNFGGQHVVRGSIEKSLTKPYEVLGKHTMVGIGIMPEAVETDEVLFDIVSEMAFSEVAPNVQTYLRKFITCRYGLCNEELLNTWNLLNKEIYCGDEVESNFESPFCSRPSLEVKGVSTWGGAAEIRDCSILINIVETLLKYYDKGGMSEAYRYDLTDFTRQLFANDSWKLVFGLQKAFIDKDVDKFNLLSGKFLKRFDLLEIMLASNESFLFGKWLEKAKRLGRTINEKRWFEHNARMLITVWARKSGDVLHDYAAREYSGLVSDYYKPRWEAFISELEISLHRNSLPEEYERYDQEVIFSYGRKVYPTKPTGDLKASIENIIKEVKSAIV